VTLAEPGQLAIHDSATAALVLAADTAERRIKKKKKLATPTKTTTIMTSKLQMPQFIPAAIGESDCP
jgi:hypothetical protein